MKNAVITCVYCRTALKMHSLRLYTVAAAVVLLLLHCCLVVHGKLINLLELVITVATGTLDDKTLKLAQSLPTILASLCLPAIPMSGNPENV